MLGIHFTDLYNLSAYFIRRTTKIHFKIWIPQSQKTEHKRLFKKRPLKSAPRFDCSDIAQSPSLVPTF
jgi:hypothetical protein